MTRDEARASIISVLNRVEIARLRARMERKF